MVDYLSLGTPIVVSSLAVGLFSLKSRIDHSLKTYLEYRIVLHLIEVCNEDLRKLFCIEFCKLFHDQLHTLFLSGHSLMVEMGVDEKEFLTDTYLVRCGTEPE